MVSRYAKFDKNAKFGSLFVNELASNLCIKHHYLVLLEKFVHKQNLTLDLTLWLVEVKTSKYAKIDENTKNGKFVTHNLGSKLHIKSL